MESDQDRIDEAVLGLMWLTLHDERWAWKGFDWECLGRLHEKGLIADPVNKSKSVVLTDEGPKRSEELFQALFARALRWRRPRASSSTEAARRSG